MIRILNAEPLGYSEAARRILQAIGQVDELGLDREGLLSRLPDYHVLVVRLGFQVDRAVIDAGGRLRAIVTATTGLDHIDVPYAEGRGIAVLSLRGEREFLRSIPATAEHAWALLLALTRRIPWAHDSVLDGKWERDDFRGHDLCGRRLGILGLGRIGERVARYGLAFGMHVAAYDPAPVGEMAGVTRCASMAELLCRSDVLSIHVPLNEGTEKLVGRAELAQLPRGALLINTSRGAVLDEAALLKALGNHQLGGAALDVVAHEREQPAAGREALLAHARAHTNLLITPHIGGATMESMRDTEVFMAEKLKRHLRETDRPLYPADISLTEKGVG